MTSPIRRQLALAGLVTLAVSLNVQRGETHKPITSKYTYNEDVFPVLRERCGRCHVPGGVAPMSLMTYGDAFPWGESIRAEIIAGHMPPWHAEPGPVRFRNAPTLTAAEMDRMLVWVSGGSPQGNPQNVPPPVLLHHDWPMGRPDLVLPLPEVTMSPDASETVREFTIPTRTTRPIWVRSADLLPGTPSIVRNATISVKTDTTDDPGRLRPEELLAIWVPGDDPVDAQDGGFRLPVSADLVVRIHYRKTYSYEGREMTDRSNVGLYLSESPLNEIQRLTLTSPPVAVTDTPVSFERTLTEELRVLAFRPDQSLTNARLHVTTVSAAGERTSVIQLSVRPDWTRRYWFDRPLLLPQGTRVEVLAVLNGADTLLPPAGSPLPPQFVDGSPVRVMLDVVRNR
ncbi:MAG TPA: hypothetical protein VM818_17550 [Vicinamibacterales bacterium]|nr:hypothetical protein [Vicinamibacterales bacterium]